MNLAKKLLLALAVTMAACDEGPMEKAGRKIDDAAEKAGDKVKDATK
ncbi:MAG TPA: hypothetical protein VF950_30865 [Planctomycetota bacterium]